MNPCIGDVYEVTYGNRRNLVIVTNVMLVGYRTGHGKVPPQMEITYQVLRGNGVGNTDKNIINRRDQWRWRKVTD